MSSSSSPPPQPTTRLAFEPYAEQQVVLDSDARFRVVAAGRRSGKTIMAAAESVRRALESDGDWHGYWVGAEHHHAETAFELFDSALPDALVKRRNRSPPRLIEYPNGAVQEFHTAGGGDLVSIGLDWAVCDEAGKDFPERTWTQELRPALSDRRGEAMFISTPDGRDWFFRRYQRGQGDDHSDWASWSWKTYANPHVSDDEVDDARGSVPDRVFRQEYLADFVDETGGVFEDLDERLFTADYDLETATGTEPYAAGWDFARHQDYFVGIVIDSDGDVVDYHRSQGDAWPQIQRTIESAAAEYPGPVALDASRDNKVVADLTDSLGRGRVEPVTFSPKRKRELIEDLIATVEAGELTAPDIPQLRHELEVFEYDVTLSGTVRYDAPEGFHDDSVDALALAVTARARKRNQPEIRRRSGSVSKRNRL
jgi:hypothetical protein